MAFTWADVALLDASLASVASPAQDMIIADVVRELNVAAWGGQERADQAGKWLAAHLAYASGVVTPGANGAAGPVTSESAGPYSRSYAQPAGAMSTDVLASTRFGREFMRLRQNYVIGRMGLVA